jgi:hypothetical protein
LSAGFLRIGNNLGHRLGNGPAQPLGHDSLLDDHHRRSLVHFTQVIKLIALFLRSNTRDNEHYP